MPLAVAADLCQRAILLREGRKVEHLTMESLLANRAMLVESGFDADFAQWVCDRKKTSGRLGSSSSLSHER